MPSTNPTPCAFGCLQYHSGTGGLVLVDTGNFPTYQQLTLNTWVWNGTTWTLTVAGLSSNPTPRVNAGLASDGTHLVLFGGKGAPETGYMNDTWLWNSGAWTNPIANDGYNNGLNVREKMYMAPMTSPAAGVVLFGGSDSWFRWQDTWTWTSGSGAWTLQSPATSPNVRNGGAFASNGTNNAILFGGANDSYMLNDTWSWNGTTWAKLATNTGPSVRKDAVMAWYPTGSYFLLFGGTDTAGNLLLDTWKFDGASTWTQLSPGTTPSGRVGAMMTYDTSSSQMIMFGGKNQKNLLNDTWQWNGTTWIQL